MIFFLFSFYYIPLSLLYSLARRIFAAICRGCSQCQPSVNFINILHVTFLYENVLRSFSIITFTCRFWFWFWFIFDLDNELITIIDLKITWVDPKSAKWLMPWLSLCAFGIYKCKAALKMFVKSTTGVHQHHAYSKLLRTKMLWHSTSIALTLLHLSLQVHLTRSYAQILSSKIIVNLLAQKLLYECWRTCKCSSPQLLFHHAYLHSTSLITLRFKYAIFLYFLWSMLYSLRSCIDLVAQKLLLHTDWLTDFKNDG